MPRKAQGTTFVSDGAIYASVTVAPRKRVARVLAWLTVDDRESAADWARTLQELVDALRSAGRAGEIEELVDVALTAGRNDPAGGLQRVRDGIGQLVAKRAAAKLVAAPTKTSALTFRKVGSMWTTGEIARKYPDHVDMKKSAHQDVARLNLLNEEIGDVLITDFTLDHALLAMGKLPKRFKPANRRQYAQVIRRVLQLSVFPLRLRAENPIPRGFLPRVRDEQENKWLYPDEEAQLVSCTDIPLVYRLAYGFLARMGFRKSEIIGGEDEESEDGTVGEDAIPPLTWDRVDLDRGVVCTARTKTTDVGRPVPLDEGVWEALDEWRALNANAADDALVFPHPDDPTQPIALTTKMLRRHLKKAGVDRAELFTSPQIRVHDLRATFVTVKLALGWTDHQVRDRTGHTTVTMLDKYRRDARTCQELEIADFANLAALVFPDVAQGKRKVAADEAPKYRFRRRDSNPDKRIQNPLSCH